MRGSVIISYIEDVSKRRRDENVNLLATGELLRVIRGDHLLEK